LFYANSLLIRRSSRWAKRLKKVGFAFRYERAFEFAGLRHRFYRLVAAEWNEYHGATRGENIRSGEGS
jgi:hypothetical protein